MFRGFALIALAFAVPAYLFSGLEGQASALFSQYLGLAALIAMALSQVIATRLAVVEHLFGPMDEAYRVHKWLGIGALAAILLHDGIDAEIRGLASAMGLGDLAEGLGEQSLNGLLVLTAVTLLTFIPYRLWYWTHKAMGATFVLGAAHFALIPKPFENADLLGLWGLGFCGLGTLAYLYTLLPLRLRRGRTFRISDVSWSGGAAVVTLAPEGAPLRHRPGQFVFLSFPDVAGGEMHPFTLSKGPQPDGHLEVTIAPSGDGTRRLVQNLQTGMEARIQGPFGHFTPRPKTPQVWIAGGVGITPFLAWLDGLPSDGPAIDLFYTFRGAQSAPHLGRVLAAVARIDRVNLHLRDTENGPRLTPDDVKAVLGSEQGEIAYCGPSSLRTALRKTLPEHRFRAEAFEIRTGLPIPGVALARTIRGCRKVAPRLRAYFHRYRTP